jgi:hypothetical protein
LSSDLNDHHRSQSKGDDRDHLESLNPGKIDLAQGDLKDERKSLLSLGHQLFEGHVEEGGKVEKNRYLCSYPSTDGIQRIPRFFWERSFWGADRRSHGNF